jgi:hypothetical protein
VEGSQSVVGEQQKGYRDAGLGMGTLKGGKGLALLLLFVRSNIIL